MPMPTTLTNMKAATTRVMSVVVNTRMNTTTINTTTKELPLLGSKPMDKANPDVEEIRRRIQRPSAISP